MVVHGYWTSTSESTTDLYAEKFDAVRFADYTPYNCLAFSARPVVSLPLDIEFILVNGVFKISH